jgi:hypothetical protein
MPGLQSGWRGNWGEEVTRVDRSDEGPKEEREGSKRFVSVASSSTCRISSSGQVWILALVRIFISLLLWVLEESVSAGLADTPIES